MTTPTKKFPILPRHPEQVCWGCDAYCSVKDMRCGNGTSRTQHPIETEGEEWYVFDAELVAQVEAEKAQREQRRLTLAQLKHQHQSKG